MNEEQVNIACTRIAVNLALETSRNDRRQSRAYRRSTLVDSFPPCFDTLGRYAHQLEPWLLQRSRPEEFETRYDLKTSGQLTR